MRILQLLSFPLYGSGSGTYVRKLSERLVKNGHKLAIVAPDSRQIKNVEIFEVKLPFMAAFTGHPEFPEAKLYSRLTGAQLNDIQSAFMETTIRAVESFQPEVIHVHHASNLSWIANYVKAVYQIHYIITSHNTDVINAVLDKRYIPLTQDALNRADTITAVSKNTRERLLKILGKGNKDLAKKTKVVPCGVDTRLFPAKGTTLKVDKKFNLKDREVILYSGKISAIKGVDIFIKAAEKFPEIHFVIMGDGDEATNMKTLVTEKKLKNIVFTGYLGSDDKDLVSEFYRRAKIVIAPSTVSEGIPMSVLEGMSSGSVVVASKIGGIPTAIKDHKNGILVKPKSVSALVAGISEVLSNDRLAARLAHNARQDAITKFDWNVIAKKMESCYRLSYTRSKKNRATKKASYITEEEYLESKGLAEEKERL